MKVLIAEDSSITASIIQHTLVMAGHAVALAENGKKALELMEKERFDFLLTDWMMPEMDGIELIRRVRDSIQPPPAIVMMTTIDSEKARLHALDSGADAFLAKPFHPKQILECLQSTSFRQSQRAPEQLEFKTVESQVLPPFVCIAVAASVGGNKAVTRLLQSMYTSTPAALMIVLHGQEWLLKTFAARLDAETNFKVSYAEHGMKIKPGEAYVAAGGRHLCVNPSNHTIAINDDPPENFVKPAADQLFRSVEKAFGRYCIAVVMTGQGSDGARGAAGIASAGGLVFVQDPDTAEAPSMPRSVIATCIPHKAASPEAIGKNISALAKKLSEELSLS